VGRDAIFSERWECQAFNKLTGHATHPLLRIDPQELMMGIIPIRIHANHSFLYLCLSLILCLSQLIYPRELRMTTSPSNEMCIAIPVAVDVTIG